MPQYDRRGDATAGDFNGAGLGTIAGTTAGMDLLAARAAASKASPMLSPTGLVSSSPTPRSLWIGVAVFVVLILYAYRRVL